MEENKHLKALILEVVDNQLRENNPPVAKETLERLVKSGYSAQKVKEMIATVLLEEMYEGLKYQKPFNEKHYREHLASLK